ncbi:late competence protein ComER [Evansella halocellulosilytica]|uniref:late competence protein ComER n=1 Tax=Evansella halocellulosilytica TaxID=2011013 RepID=UPI00211BA5F3|nr:late competence protein ComER [Evansella halocellulosilytica]
MKRVGFIGTGSMGSILIESFIEARALTPTDVTITNRTMEKALHLARSYKGMKVVSKPEQVIQQCEWIFLCVKPHQMIPLLRNVKGDLTGDHTIISITSPLLVEELECVVEGGVVRFIPSIVNRALEGPSLVTFGQQIEKEEQQQFMDFFRMISRPQIINDSITRVASDLGSCGPAFLSYLLERMIQGATEETEITNEQATNIVESMLIGYGELLRQNHFTLPTLRERVTVPGGVTGEGLKVLEKEVGKQFNYVFQRTHEKFSEDRKIIKEQLEESD